MVPADVENDRAFVCPKSEDIVLPARENGTKDA